MLACLSPNGLNSYQGDAACDRLLVGTIAGVAVLEKSQGVWRRSGTVLAGQHISSLLYEPKKGGLFAGVHRGRIHFSADQGRTWEERASGLSVEHVYTLACNMEGGEPVLYAGTEPVNLFRSRDYGRSWQEIPIIPKVKGVDKWAFPMPPNIPHVKTIAFDPRDSRVILVGVEQGGLFRSADGGDTWTELDAYYKPSDAVYKDLHQVTRRPNHPDEIVMATGNGYYLSSDDGKSWSHLTDPAFRSGYPDKLAFNPLDDGQLFMCGADDNPGTWRVLHYAHPAVMQSRDMGRSWQDASAGLPKDMVPSIEALSIVASKDGVELFGGTTAGEVWHSADGAKSWQCLSDELEAVSKSAHFRLLLPGGPGGPGGPGAPGGSPGGPPGQPPSAPPGARP